MLGAHIMQSIFFADEVLPPNVEEEIVLHPLRQTLFAKQGSAPVKNSEHERASERISIRA